MSDQNISPVNRNYIFIPFEIIHHKDLGLTSGAVFGSIFSFDMSKGYSTVPNVNIAKDIGISASRVSAHMAKLVKYGFIRSEWAKAESGGWERRLFPEVDYE